MSTPYKKKILKILQEIEADENASKNNNILGFSPDTAIAGGVGAAKMLLGTAGLFAKNVDLPETKATYQQDPGLKAASNYATSKAIATPDDIAARIRLRNQRVAQTMQGIGMSGGDRNYIAAIDAASRDAENLGNLQVDVEQQKLQQQNLSIAANMQQMALFDRLNESRDKLGVAEMNLKSQMFETEQRNRNVLGAAQMIAGGLDDISKSAGNEIVNKAQADYRKIALLNVMSKLGISQEEEAKKTFEAKEKQMKPEYFDPAKKINIYERFLL